MPTKSDGGPSEYYDFPEGATTLNDLIEHKDMSFAQGNIFKAAYRMGTKEGISLKYDLKKIKYYADRMLDQIDRGNDAKTTKTETLEAGKVYLTDGDGNIRTDI